MSECVVMMEMPQDGVCDGCGARTIDFLAGPICTIKKKFLGSSRPSWCPIICSLPEGHGPLVDKDEMLKKIENYHRYMTIGRESDPRCIIEDSPTIVPAEAERSET